MSFEVIPTPIFEKQAKKLIKKYPLFKKDLEDFGKSIRENPEQGDYITESCFKIRIPITGKQAGKSGGARVVIHVKYINQRVYLLSVYDKSYKEDLEESVDSCAC